MSILFYDDSPVFGGHEVMTLLGLEALLATSSEKVVFMVAAANERLRDGLEKMAERHQSLVVEVVDDHSSKLEALRNLLWRGRIHGLADRIRAFAPSLVVAVQGNIEHSSLSLHAARRAGVRCVSYIPVPHTHAEMGARGGALRDLFCNHLFQLPDGFITVTAEMARMLERRGATCPIYVVANGVNTERFRAGDRAAARDQLGLPSSKTIFGMIGRIEFCQKQQDLLVRALASESSLSGGCHAVFAGEGPDVEVLRAMIASHGLSATVLPWSDPVLIHQAIDALVIPSRYEGLPLVMLEALACGTAVIGSDQDGMKDVLPAEWRFQAGQSSALAAVLSRFMAERLPAPAPELVARVRETMSLQAFGRSFSSRVSELAGMDSQSFTLASSA